MSLMSHLNRVDFQKNSPKCIYVSKMPLIVGHHSHVGCVDPGGICKPYLVDREDGYFLHHRFGQRIKSWCKDRHCVIYDPIVLKYKTRLEYNMKNALVQIFALPLNGNFYNIE